MPILTFVSTPESKGRAVCGNSARTDLRGGCRLTGTLPQPMLRDNLVGSSRRCCRGADIHVPRSTPQSHRIGRPLCLENPRPIGAELITNGERSPLHFTLSRNKSIASNLNQTYFEEWCLSVLSRLLRLLRPPFAPFEFIGGREGLHGRGDRAWLRHGIRRDARRDARRGRALGRDSPCGNRSDDRRVRRSEPVRGTKVLRR